MRDLGAGALAGYTVLVTGARGFIGSHLWRHLLQAKDVELHAISRRPIPQESSARWWQVDLERAEELRQVLSEVRPDIVFHLAGYPFAGRELRHVLPALRRNLVTSVNVMTLLAELGCHRLVLAGSLEEPRPSDSELVPTSPYAASKVAGSLYARMFHEIYRVPVVVARIFMTYGPGQHDLAKLIPYTADCILRGETPQYTSGLRQVDWIFVQDVVDGLVAMATAPRIVGCTLDLGSGKLVSIRELVRLLFRSLDASAEPRFGAIPDRPAEEVQVANVAYTQEKLRWRPRTTLEAGLAQTVHWYRQHYAQSVGCSR